MEQNRSVDLNISGRRGSLIVFDLDGTLAELGKPIPAAICQILCKWMMRKDLRLAIASGKPLYYLTGLCRQAGLDQIWLIGENGMTMQYGVSLPPVDWQISDAAISVIPILSNVKQAVIKEFNRHVWFQPNEVCLTIFFDDHRTQQTLKAWLAQRQSDLLEHGVQLFQHNDSFDLTASHVDKGIAILGLKKRLKQQGFEVETIISIGDSSNDLSMFAVSDVVYSLGNILSDLSELPLEIERHKDIKDQRCAQVIQAAPHIEAVLYDIERRLQGK